MLVDLDHIIYKSPVKGILLILHKSEIVLLAFPPKSFSFEVNKSTQVKGILRMIVSEKILHFFKPSAILLFIPIFLAFGYCPVRDALFSAPGSTPQTAQHKKIGEIKTFTYHICQESGPDKITVLAHISNANLLAFIAVAILIFCTSIVDLQKMAVRYQDIAVISSNQVPIYLRNKVLRI